MGLAPKEVPYADSVPPMPYGGNLDDKRIGYACQQNVADPSCAAPSLRLAADEAVSWRPVPRLCALPSPARLVFEVDGRMG